MQRPSLWQTLLLSTLATLPLAAPAVHAATVLKMDLGELCSRAHLIYRGRILDIEAGTTLLGGAELPTLTYTVEVSETLVGDPASFTDKDDRRIAHITMVAGKQTVTVSDGIARFSKLPAMPDLRRGEEYLLMTTRPGPSGLSTTVGLGQGCFHIDARNGMAANELQNVGLSSTIGEPVAYSQIADEIRALLGQ